VRDHFDVVAFDADDTLWHSEESFRRNERQFVELVEPYVDEGIDVKSALVAIEGANLSTYGYGVKSFGLCAIEAALTLSNGTIPHTVLEQVISSVKEHLTEPVRLFDEVASVVSQVARHHRVVMITKGDLVHQTRKVRTSGLAHLFHHVEIVLEKDAESYRRVLNGLDVDPTRFCMVGNSLKSDILPVLEIGGFGVHVPFEILWELESAERTPGEGERWIELKSLDHLPAWLAGDR
jgi:putative hydrolase of the HAD superfamily